MLDLYKPGYWVLLGFGDSFIDARQNLQRMVITTLLVVVTAVASMTSAWPIFNLSCDECDDYDLICDLFCCGDDSDESTETEKPNPPVPAPADVPPNPEGIAPAPGLSANNIPPPAMTPDKGMAAIPPAMEMDMMPAADAMMM